MLNSPRSAGRATHTGSTADHLGYWEAYLEDLAALLAG
jgi:hypothetical protein